MIQAVLRFYVQAGFISRGALKTYLRHLANRPGIKDFKIDEERGWMTSTFSVKYQGDEDVILETEKQIKEFKRINQ